MGKWDENYSPSSLVMGGRALGVGNSFSRLCETAAFGMFASRIQCYGVGPTPNL